MDIYDMCKADSNIQPFKVDPLDSTVMGQVNPGDLLLSAKVCDLDISTEMYVNEFLPAIQPALLISIDYNYKNTLTITVSKYRTHVKD